MIDRNSISQAELFSHELGGRWERAFDEWKDSPGGAHLMRWSYRIASGYGERFVRTGRRVSVKLIWELLRDRLKMVRSQLKERGILVNKINGFTLNNVFTAYVARHIMENHVVAGKRPWLGMFETRDVGRVRTKRKVLVIDEPVGRAALNEKLTDGGCVK